jgi:hypothetical protein
MSDPIVSEVVFNWFITLLTASLAGTWLFYDAYKLVRLAKADKTDPTVHDKRFGYSIGVVIGIIGVSGSAAFILKFHGVV